MSLNTVKGLPEKCMRWANPVPDGRGGHSYDEADELCCRWQDKAEMFYNPEGREDVSRSIVYLREAVVPGEWLWLGAEEDLPSDSSDPGTVTGAAKVRGVDRSKDVRGRVDLYKAYL